MLIIDHVLKILYHFSIYPPLARIMPLILIHDERVARSVHKHFVHFQLPCIQVTENCCRLSIFERAVIDSLTDTAI